MKRTSPIKHSLVALTLGGASVGMSGCEAVIAVAAYERGKRQAELNSVNNPRTAPQTHGSLESYYDDVNWADNAWGRFMIYGDRVQFVSKDGQAHVSAPYGSILEVESREGGWTLMLEHTDYIILKTTRGDHRFNFNRKENVTDLAREIRLRTQNQ